VNVKVLQRQTGLVAPAGSRLRVGASRCQAPRSAPVPGRSHTRTLAEFGTAGRDRRTHVAAPEDPPSQSYGGTSGRAPMRRHPGLNPRPIQPPSGLAPAQSGLIRSNPANDKKNKSPRNRVMPLLKKYDQIALNRTKSHQIIPNMAGFFYFFPPSPGFCLRQGVGGEDGGTRRVGMACNRSESKLVEANRSFRFIRKRRPSGHLLPPYVTVVTGCAVTCDGLSICKLFIINTCDGVTAQYPCARQGHETLAPCSFALRRPRLSFTTKGEAKC
jgi:hypothetical protein